MLSTRDVARISIPDVSYRKGVNHSLRLDALPLLFFVRKIQSRSIPNINKRVLESINSVQPGVKYHVHHIIPIFMFKWRKHLVKRHVPIIGKVRESDPTLGRIVRNIEKNPNHVLNLILLPKEYHQHFIHANTWKLELQLKFYSNVKNVINGDFYEYLQMCIEQGYAEWDDTNDDIFMMVAAFSTREYLISNRSRFPYYLKTATMHEQVKDVYDLCNYIQEYRPDLYEIWEEEMEIQES